MKAIWKEKVIAESDKTINVENNQYFPAESVNMEFLQKTETHTICPWKGETSYYNVVVGGDVNPNAAWYYPQPKDMAKQIKNYIAFWKGVQIVKD